MPLTSVQTPADLANVTLARIGWKGRDIGDLYEGSEVANVVLDVYGQVRDALLRSDDWDFAQRTASLVLQKQAPVGGYIPGITPWSTAYPPPGWNFQYAYPQDAIKIRAVKPVPLFIPNYDPVPNVFSIGNDALTSQEVILCNVDGAVCIYTARVTDPMQWAVSFTEAFIDALGVSVAAGLTGMDQTKAAAAEGGQAMAMATMEQG